MTLPGRFLRGRVGLMYSKLLEIEECVAKDVEDYARLAVTIANDAAFRESIQARILANNHRLFESRQSSESIAGFLRDVGRAGSPAA